MADDLIVSDAITIPAHELIITTSRASGPGGQHVNKSDTRITLTWNVLESTACTPEQKELIRTKLHTIMNQEGALVIHSSSSRSQLQNKRAAYKKLAEKIRSALKKRTKRIKTAVSQATKEQRLQAKKLHSKLKQSRSKIDF